MSPRASNPRTTSLSPASTSVYYTQSRTAVSVTPKRIGITPAQPVDLGLAKLDQAWSEFWILTPG